MTAIALQLIVTGALTGTAAWLPAAIEPDPSVVEPCPPEDPLPPDGVEPAQVALASPITAAELQPMVTGAVSGTAAWLPLAVEPDPSVVEPPPEGPMPPEVGVLAHPALAPRTTATELQPTVTGAVTGTAAWLPPPSEPDPSVVEPCPLGGWLPPDGVEPAQVALASPITPAELQPTVTGAVTGTAAWLPPSADPEASVVEPWPPEGPLPPDGVEPAQVALAPRTTAAELQPTVTGALTGIAVWLPAAIEPDPSVVEPCPLGGWLPPEVGVLAHPALAPRTTATELQPTVTGALTGTAAWLPAAIEPEPSVVEPCPPEDPLPPDGVEPAQVALASPNTATELQPTVTGALTGTAAWLPLAVEPDPSVVEPCPLGGWLPPEVGVLAHPALAPRTTATELQPTVTGALTGTAARLPPAVECEASVRVVSDVLCVPELCDDAGVLLEDESPITATELPLTVTGATTETEI